MIINEQKFNEIFRRESIVFDLVLSELVKYSIADVMKLQPDDISINLESDVLVAVADLSRPKLKRILKQVVGEVNTSRGLANLIENSSKFIKIRPFRADFLLFICILVKNIAIAA